MKRIFIYFILLFFWVWEREKIQMQGCFYQILQSPISSYARALCWFCVMCRPLEKERLMAPGPSTGAVIGGLLGALAIIGIVVGLVFFVRRRQRDAEWVLGRSEWLLIIHATNWLYSSDCVCFNDHIWFRHFNMNACHPISGPPKHTPPPPVKSGGSTELVSKN